MDRQETDQQKFNSDNPNSEKAKKQYNQDEIRTRDLRISNLLSYPLASVLIPTGTLFRKWLTLAKYNHELKNSVAPV